MSDTISIKVYTSEYENLRKALIKKNNDLRKGDLLKALSKAIEKYIAEEL